MATDVPSSEEWIVLAYILMAGENVVIDTILITQEGFTWRLTKEGWNIAPHSLPDVPPNLVSASAVKNMFGFINSRPICCGNPDEKFRPILNARNGNFMDGSGMLCVYSETHIYYPLQW